MKKKQTYKRKSSKVDKQRVKLKKSIKLNREMTKAEIDKFLFNIFCLFMAIDDQDMKSVNLEDPLLSKYISAIDDGLNIYLKTRIL